MLVGTCFVHDTVGPNPTIDLSAPADKNPFLRLFAYANVLSTLCLGNQRSIFTFVKPLPSHRVDLGCHSGLPGGLLILMAETSALAVNMSSLEPQLVEECACRIEDEIKTWRAVDDGSNRVVGVSRLDATVNEEMWRLVSQLQHCAESSPSPQADMAPLVARCRPRSSTLPQPSAASARSRARSKPASPT